MLLRAISGVETLADISCLAMVVSHIIKSWSKQYIRWYSSICPVCSSENEPSLSFSLPSVHNITRLPPFSLIMCMQEIIWCSCGHGEFLPIERCPTGKNNRECFTVVHGNHNIVVELPCSYCQAGWNRKTPLGSPRPREELTRSIESNRTVGARYPSTGDGREDTVPLNDVVDMEFGGGFDLEKELECWQYG